MSKAIFGFKTDDDFVEFIDKIISLGQFDLTQTSYNDRSDFARVAVVREAKRFLEEVNQVPMLAPLAAAILDAHDGEKLLNLVLGVSADANETNHTDSSNNKGGNT